MPRKEKYFLFSKYHSENSFGLLYPLFVNIVSHAVSSRKEDFREEIAATDTKKGAAHKNPWGL